MRPSPVSDRKSCVQRKPRRGRRRTEKKVPLIMRSVSEVLALQLFLLVISLQISFWLNYLILCHHYYFLLLEKLKVLCIGFLSPATKRAPINLEGEARCHVSVTRGPKSNEIICHKIQNLKLKGELADINKIDFTAICDHF